MKPVFALAGLAALAAASDVHELTKDTFGSFVEEHSLVLAEFFAPWCGHCKALAPEYEEAATELKAKEIQLAKIDCTAESELCAEYGVEGYPTLKVFRGKEDISPYAGPRKAQAIVSYMTKMSMPPVSILGADAAALESFKTADSIVVVGYFAADDRASNETFTTVAKDLRDTHLFGATNDAALAKAEGVTPPAIVLYKDFDEGKNSFAEAFDKETITKFVKTASVPLVGELGPDTYAGYISSGIPLAYIFYETAEDKEALVTALRPIAEAQKGKLNFASIDAKAFGAHAGNINLEVGKWPAFAIHDSEKNHKFPFSLQGDVKGLSVESITSFVADVISGKIEPSVKSEPIPEKQDGPVTIVVAHNYNDVVIENEKDVLVEFYAPWCGHCKALAPKYDELGLAFGPFASQVTIAKVDATANDVPDEIQGFPTIKLFPAGDKTNPIEFSGARNVEDLANFIRDNGSHHVDAFGSAEGATAAVETEGMPHQAAAATEAIKKAAEAVVDAALGDEAGADEHDEL